MEVLSRKKDQGFIRHIGLCNTNVIDFKLASEIDEISLLQSEYNIFNCGYNDELIELMKNQSILSWGWGTFDKGIISGSVNEPSV